MYTRDELLALNRHDLTPARSVRKTIFSYRLWRPLRQRRHAARVFKHDEARRSNAISCSGLSLGLGGVNACSLSSKEAMLCRTIIDERLDVLVVTETWHDGPQSSSLKRATPPGYIDAARSIQPGAAVNTVEFQNHGGLAILYRDVV